MTDIERRMAAKQFAADWNGKGDEKQETQDKKEDVHKVIRLKKVMKPMILVAGVAAKSLWHTRTGKIY